MPVEQLLMIFAIAITIAMVCQAIFVIRLSLSSKRLVDRLQHVSDELESEAKGLVGQLQEIIDSFEHLRRISERVESRTDEFSQMFGDRVREIDSLMGQLVDVGSRQAEKVDLLVTDTIEKFSETTDVIQQDIVRPVVEISSLVKGIRTGLEYLFSKRQIRSEEDYPEDELFI